MVHPRTPPPHPWWGGGVRWCTCHRTPPGTLPGRTERASGLNGLAGRAHTREYPGIPGNTREYRGVPVYTGIHGNTGNTGNTGIPGIPGNTGNTRNTRNTREYPGYTGNTRNTREYREYRGIPGIPGIPGTREVLYLWSFLIAFVEEVALATDDYYTKARRAVGLVILLLRPVGP